MAGRTYQSILMLEVPIIVRLGERPMKLSETTALTPGSIIELSIQADEELDLLVNNVPIGRGSAVKVGENFGLNIAFIGDLATRIGALGGQVPPGDAAESDPDADAAALAEQFLNG
ncbi:MAG: FliM/FliN family flagellar motor C-terminal domain-containing protein [Planctomycetota bacterium]